MRPVSLVPDGRAVTGASGPQMQLVMFAAIGVFVILSYFAWSRVHDINAQATTLETTATQQDAEAQKLQAQIDEAGQKTDYTQIGQSVEADLLSKVKERVDFARFTRELGQITPNAAVDLKSVTVTAPSGATVATDGEPLQISGVAKDVATVAAYVTRVNAMTMVEKAHVTKTSEVNLENGGKAVAFDLGASLTTVGGDVTSGDPNAETVGAGSTTATELALVPEPGYGKHKSSPAKLADKVELTALQELSSDAATYNGSSEQ
jgi:Tfp pilus assembly protein PilN